MASPSDFIIDRGSGEDRKVGIRWGRIASTITASLLALNITGLIKVLRNAWTAIPETLRLIGAFLDRLVMIQFAIAADFADETLAVHAAWLSDLAGLAVYPILVLEMAAVAYLFSLGTWWILKQALGGLA